MISNRRHDKVVHEKDRIISNLLNTIDRQANQIMHLSGRPWTPAPADMVTPPPEDDSEPTLVQPHHWPDE